MLENRRVSKSITMTSQKSNVVSKFDWHRHFLIDGDRISTNLIARETIHPADNWFATWRQHRKLSLLVGTTSVSVSWVRGEAKAPLLILLRRISNTWSTAEDNILSYLVAIHSTTPGSAVFEQFFTIRMYHPILCPSTKTIFDYRC